MEAKGQKRFLLVLSVMLFLSVVAAHGAKTDALIPASMPGSGGSGDGGVLTEVTGALFGNIDFANFYNLNHTVIDFILLSILFIGLSYFGLYKVFMREDSPSNAGKAVMVSVGIALAFGGIVFMQSFEPDLTLASFGPIAMGVLLILLAFTFYEIASALGVPRYIAFAFAYLIMYYTASAYPVKDSQSIMVWLKVSAPIVMALLNLIKAGCIIIAFYGLWILFVKAMKGIRGEVVPGADGTDTGTLSNVLKKDAREVEDERREMVLDREAGNLNKVEQDLEKIELNDEVAELRDLKELSEVLLKAASTARAIEAERGRRRP